MDCEMAWVTVMDLVQGKGKVKDLEKDLVKEQAQNLGMKRNLQ
jgi:hypothetical protein